MSNKSYLKKFIIKFKFNNHTWSGLPQGFPDCNTKGLSLAEKYILDGIKLAYTNEHFGKLALRKAAKTGFALIIFILISLITLTTLTHYSSNDEYAKPVNAATVSATLKQFDIRESIGNAIESTFSAVLKR